jgi:transposase
MARPRRIDKKAVARAQKAVTQATTLEELRAAQAVLLPAVVGTTLTQTAALIGVGRATVARLQTSFKESGSREITKRGRKNWGGRRNALLSLAQEEEFLLPWLEQARKGGVLVVSPLRAALAEKLGKPVKASVVYRLLARHGWRKVAPDTRHPKSDPQAQAEWKKNFPRRWRPY